MTQTLTPLAGLYEPDEIAAMALVLNEVAAEIAPLGLLDRFAKSEIRPAIGRIIIEIQSRQRLQPAQLKAAVLTRLEEQARRRR